MYVQTYREQQQLQQENNQSPGPPAIPPDIQVSVCNLRIGPFQIISFRPIRKIWFESWRNTCTGIKDHEGGGSLFPGLSHGLVPLGPQTGKNNPYYTLQNKNENISSQGQTSSIPFAYYHFARDKLEDYREAKARAESILMLDENVVHSWDVLVFVAVNKAFILSKSYVIYYFILIGAFFDDMSKLGHTRGS